MDNIRKTRETEEIAKEIKWLEEKYAVDTHLTKKDREKGKKIKSKNR